MLPHFYCCKSHKKIKTNILGSTYTYKGCFAITLCYSEQPKNK